LIDRKGYFVALKNLGMESEEWSGGSLGSAQLESDPVLGGKVIDFEFAKRAMDQTGRSHRQHRLWVRESSRLPDLAAEDWFDWTALCALFGGVALLPFLAILLFG
jgi:hypothetical protein